MTSDIKNAMNSNTYKYSHEWGVGLGFAFYMFKNVGIFAEYSVGKYYLVVPYEYPKRRKI